MNTSTNVLNEEGIELKTTKKIKILLKQAASLNGQDVPTFIIESALEKAGVILNRHDSIALTIQGKQNLVQLLHENLKPTKAMEELMELPNLSKRKC